MKNLGLDDVTLVPRVISEISSRDQISLDINFCGFNLKSPIISAPMVDVCDVDLAKKMIENNCLPILHRFCEIEQHIKNVLEVGVYNSCCAIGIEENEFERFKSLYRVGCKFFCIDVANGASIKVANFIKKIEEVTDNVNLIVGNVASAETFDWVQKLPFVKGIRVGIAGGRSCTTKNATGIFNGLISAILECKQIKRNDKFIIADGGIREPSDVCKCLAAGADLVMLGSVIAELRESPAEIIESVYNNKEQKLYRGSASFEIQKLYKEIPKYIEGKSSLLDINEEGLENLINRFNNGIKSSMSYFNAKNYQEYRKNVTFNNN